MGLIRWFLATTLSLAAGVACAGGDNFDFGIVPYEVAVAPGETFTVSVQLVDKNDIDTRVFFLRVTGLPPDSTFRFEPDVIKGPSTRLTIEVSPDAPQGDYQPRIHAQEEGFELVTHFFELTVSHSGPKPSFVLRVSQNEHTFTEPGRKGFTYGIDERHGFTGTVTIEVEGFTDDFMLDGGDDFIEVVIDENTTGGGYHFEVSYSPTPPVDRNVILTVNATGEGIRKTETIHLRALPEPAVPEQPEEESAEPVGP
jgi:hypothetical protein